MRSYDVSSSDRYFIAVKVSRGFIMQSVTERGARIEISLLRYNYLPVPWDGLFVAFRYDAINYADNEIFGCIVLPPSVRKTGVTSFFKLCERLRVSPQNIIISGILN